MCVAPLRGNSVSFLPAVFMLRRLVQIEANERSEFLWSAAWFSTVLGAYYIVRPVREALGSIEGSRDLRTLFTAVFVTMLIMVPIYSMLVNTFERRILVPVIYRFLALNLITFSLCMRFLDPESLKLVARVFFVWVTVYVLFSTSLFWSVMADVFSKEEGKRLFGYIAGVGTGGAILASLFVTQASQRLGPENLLLLSAGLMETGLWCFRHLKRNRGPLQSDGTTQQSANPFSGFTHVITSPYLRAIMIYTFVVTSCGTCLYVTQADTMKQAYPDNSLRTAAFASIDLWVQLVTVGLQLIAARPIMKFSLTVAVCILPLVYATGFLWLTLAPSLVVLVVAMVTARSTTYGLAVPALGVLYTVCTREDKYKARNVIDTLVIRGSDATANWLLSALRAAGASATAVTAAMVPVALTGALLALLLGRRNARAVALNQGGIDVEPDA
jgi:AAA family ATP:ADP antiporter